MIEVQSSYEPIAWQKKMHESNWRWAWFLGAKGSAKTRAALEELIACAVEYPGTRYIIARKTLPSLKDSTWREFLAIIPQELIADNNKADRNVTLTNGSVFMGRPLDEIKKFESMEITGFFIDEGDEIEKEMHDTLKTRVRQKILVDGVKIEPQYRGILASNPPDEDHWLVDVFFHMKPANHQVFQSTTFDNQANLPEGYIDLLRQTYSPEMQQRMIYGQLGKVHKGRPVFPQFARGNYIRPFQAEPKIPVYRCLDFGFNRPACVWLQVVGKQLRVLGESMGQRIYLDDFLKQKVFAYERDVLQLPDETKYLAFCDPAGSQESDKGKTSVEILNDHGIYPVYRRTKIEEGIKALKSYLDTQEEQDPCFIIHPRCQILIEGFRGGYHRLDGVDEPAKDGYYDHCLAEGTLVSTRYGQKPIQAILPGDEVKTRFGHIPVALCHDNGVRSCLKVTTESGREIVATPEHRLFINGRGWTTMDALRYGESLQPEEAWDKKLSRLSSMGSASEGIPHILIKRLLGTIVRTLATSALEFPAYIATFGKSLTALSQRAVTSITSTAIRTTTAPQILSASVRQSIERSTEKICWLKSAHQNTSHIWTDVGSSPKLGTQAPLGSHGTEATQSFCSKRTERKSGSSAGNAGDLTGRTFLQRLGQNIATLIAGLALYVPEGDRIVSIEKVGQRRVYDLTVPWAHEYMANGVVVKNCMDALRYGAVHIYKRMRFNIADSKIRATMERPAYVSKHTGYRREW